MPLKTLWKFFFLLLNSNIKLWWSLCLIIKKNLFRPKARSLIFLKILLLSLHWTTLYMVLTHLWFSKWKFEKLPVVLFQLLYMIHKLRRTIKSCETDSSMSPKRQYIFITDPAFSTWNVIPHSLKQSSKPGLHRDESLTFHYQLKNFNSNLNWPPSIWFQHRMNFN